MASDDETPSPADPFTLQKPPVWLPVKDLYPHPHNPRIVVRQNVVDDIGIEVAGGFDLAHALLVRPLDDGTYQILSGHHRVLAAGKAGLELVPCWVRELDDNAHLHFMALVVS